jgi:hypothetical protein
VGMGTSDAVPPGFFKQKGPFVVQL